ncbi:MAG: molybdopterin-dependent oxidoreductase [Betaproteobacteria bacterium]
MRSTRSTCPYCGVGCGVLIKSRGEQIVGVEGDPEHPANFGRLCTKGSTLHLTARAEVQQQLRLLQPMQRLERGGAAQPLAWEPALGLASQRLAEIWQRHGPDAIGVYVSGQLLTEDYYVFNKLVKGLLGSNHIDTNSRLCMSSAVAGYKATLGADAPPCSYEDLALAQTVLITGSNMAWAHPVLFARLEEARRANPQQKWIVVDPRRTETAERADLHLQLLPGSDVALMHGMLHLMLWESLIDRRYIEQHTSGFEALRDRVREWTPQAAARATGCREDDIVTAARWFAASPASLSLYCQGLNQSSSGTDKNIALINLHLATGQIGKPGAGPFSLTGQPNAMGGREVGGLANLLSAHRDLARPQDRAEVAALWGLPDVPATPGRTAVEMFQAAADGEVKALWIACTNPAQSLPDQAMVRRALERAEFVLVQESFANTATAQWADLLLPATTWGEKDGTVTNSERRISRVRAAVAAPGQARHDWAMAVDIAQRLARQIGPASLTPEQRVAMFDYPDAQSIWEEHRASTQGRDLDITGLSYELLEQVGPQQWPMAQGQTQGRARLYEDGVFPTADGRARFVDIAPRPLAETRRAAFPFSLNTGRLRDQWHGMSRTGTLGRLLGHTSQPMVELHPQDMARLRLVDGDEVGLSSGRGQVVLSAKGNAAVAPAQAFVPMHWGSESLIGRTADGRLHGGINELTTPVFCPKSKQPELKHTAIRVEKLNLSWRLMARVWLPGRAVLALRQQLMQMLAQDDFKSLVMASVLPFGREEADADSAGGDVGDRGSSGLVLRAAASQPLPLKTLAPIAALLGLDGPALLAYEDAPHAQQRRLLLDAGGQRLRGYWLAGDTSGHELLDSLVLEATPLPGAARLLLAPGALRQRWLQAAPRSAQICTCLDVNEARIRAVLLKSEGQPEQRLQALQTQLRCGTECGSCLPRLRTLVAEIAPEAGAAAAAAVAL